MTDVVKMVTWEEITRFIVDRYKASSGLLARPATDAEIARVELQDDGCVLVEMSACDIGCDEYGYPVRPSAFEKISAGLNDALDIVRGYPVVTAQMVDAGLGQWHPHNGDYRVVLSAIYIAMHTARPLSEGPV